MEGYKAAAETLLARGVGCVLVTLGGDGCITCTAEETVHVSAVPLPKESVVDTTGAGDAFTGAFAVFRGMGLSIPVRLLDSLAYVFDPPGLWTHCFRSIGYGQEAAGRAGKVASLTVQVEGTQPSYPTKEAVLEQLPDIFQ